MKVREEKKNMKSNIALITIYNFKNHRGVWSNSLGWCTRCTKCEIQGSGPNIDLLGLPPLAT